MTQGHELGLEFQKTLFANHRGSEKLELDFEILNNLFSPSKLTKAG